MLIQLAKQWLGIVLTPCKKINNHPFPTIHIFSLSYSFLFQYAKTVSEENE